MADKWYAIYFSPGDSQFNEPLYTFDDYEIFACEKILDPGTPVPGGNVIEINETQYDIWFNSVANAEQKYYLVTNPVVPLQNIVLVDWTFSLADQKLNVFGELTAAWQISVGTWVFSTVTSAGSWVTSALDKELDRFNDVGSPAGDPYPLLNARVGSDDGGDLAAVVVTLNAEAVTRMAAVTVNEGQYVTLRDLVSAAADLAALEVLRLTIPTAFNKNASITSTIK